MNPTDLIGRCRPFEPPFRRRGKNIKDRNLHTLLQVKAYGTLREAPGIDIEEGARTIADHICDLLNREHYARYQVYEIDREGRLLQPATTPLHGLQRANECYNECYNVALVEIDDDGAITQVLKSKHDNTDPRRKPRYYYRKPRH